MRILWFERNHILSRGCLIKWHYVLILCASLRILRVYTIQDPYEKQIIKMEIPHFTIEQRGSWIYYILQIRRT